MKRIVVSLIISAICSISVGTAGEGKYYVPDAATAIRIAIAFWERILSPEQVAKSKPFHAKLKNDIWIVDGSLPVDRVDRVPVTKVSQKDGRNVRFSRTE
jgi:hypothetical protein